MTNGRFYDLTIYFDIAIFRYIDISSNSYFSLFTLSLFTLSLFTLSLFISSPRLLLPSPFGEGAGVRLSLRPEGFNGTYSCGFQCGNQASDSAGNDEDEGDAEASAKAHGGIHEEGGGEQPRLDGF